MKDIAIESHQLTVHYDRKVVLHEVDVSIKAGRLTGIIGPNGAGKSTFIKSIMGVLPRTSGWIQVLGKPSHQVKKQIAYVPQRESVDWDFPVTVFDVVLMGTYPKMKWWQKVGVLERANAQKALEKVQLVDYANTPISDLSGGQQQRVFLARALAQNAHIYLLDEPFAGVDMASEQNIMQVLKGMRDAGKTVVVVHHDLYSAQHYFDDVILLNKRLIGAGESSVMLQPEYLSQAYGSSLTLLTQMAHEMSKK